MEGRVQHGPDYGEDLSQDVAAEDAEANQDLAHSHDERQPTPCRQVAEQEFVGMEVVVVDEERNAVDDIERPDDQE